ncbi:hypothetical protein J4032_22225 [Streptomyces formicae]|uniref:HTH cro/C1-type domain-containing protein n=1 Tax=Streptomyces formicae TaxID=1616117 RepID=A0ABY3WMD7_9ACTN|nr:hypothetical protein [Streptomyces formicae]UNM13813.1 hypothetical protein J4032_22225 [Streptomyces formicae]
MDAEPVREHVKVLSEFGIGWMRLAKLAGVPRGCMSKLLYGDPQRGMSPSKRMRANNATAILSVEPTLNILGARVRVDGTGTRRRLQALVAAGWTQSELARRLGMLPENFSKTIASELVVVATVRAVLALYDELWRAGPVANGVPAYRAEAARRRAAELRWAPVGSWDDDAIDDPAAFPDWTGRCGTPEGYTAHYRVGIPVCPACRQARAAARTKAAA